jgi:hypothetical protein
MSNIDAKKRAVREIKAINGRLDEIEKSHNDNKMEKYYNYPNISTENNYF